MFLSDFHPTSPKHRKTTSTPDIQAFDQTLRNNLHSLLSSTPNPQTLTLITSIIHLLSTSLSDSTSISTTLSLLRFCNAVTATLDSLRHRLLLLRYALHLLSVGKTSVSREVLLEFQQTQLLAGGDTPAIYATDAVETVSSLVSSLLLAYLNGKEKEIQFVRIPGEFAYGEIGVAGGMGELEVKVRRIVEIIDGDGGEERVRIAAEELGKSAEVVMEGLDGLGDAVDGLFRSAMRARNAAVDRFRVGPHKCV